MTKEQAFGMYFRIAKVYHISHNHIGNLHYCELDAEDKRALDKIKLVLRPLSEMTDEEVFECEKRQEGAYLTENITRFHTPESIEYLISIGIDIFDLHSRGWAVYESEVKDA